MNYAKPKYICQEAGCENGLVTGHTLYRITPKGPGTWFLGVCREHATPEQIGDDDVERIIETDQRRKRAPVA